jgi:hypothetical protein
MQKTAVDPGFISIFIGSAQAAQRDDNIKTIASNFPYFPFNSNNNACQRMTGKGDFQLPHFF